VFVPDGPRVAAGHLVPVGVEAQHLKLCAEAEVGLVEGVIFTAQQIDGGGVTGLQGLCGGADGVEATALQQCKVITEQLFEISRLRIAKYKRITDGDGMENEGPRKGDDFAKDSWVRKTNQCRAKASHRYTADVGFIPFC